MTEYKMITERTENSVEYVVYQDEKFVVVMEDKDLESVSFTHGHDFLTEVAKSYRTILNANKKIKSIETKFEVNE
jgi:hypothetical protein